MTTGCFLGLALSPQQSGQGASERLHNAEKCISTKTRNRLGDKVKDALTEVKMSRMRKRSEEEQHKKTYKSSDKVTVLGLVCAKMAKRVLLARQEEEDRQLRLEEANVATILENDAGEEQDKQDDEGAADERDIWEVVHVTE